jgi:hypothetical protein
MFHGANNVNHGKVIKAALSDHARASYYARNGHLPYIKLLNDVTQAHANPKHVCADCAIEFNPNTSFVGMTTGKRLQIMGNGVKAVGKPLRSKLVSVNPELADSVIDLGPVDVLWYETPEKHSDSDNPPPVNYYHNHGEDSGRTKDKPHLMLDAEGMMFLRGGNYDITSAGIEN